MSVQILFSYGLLSASTESIADENCPRNMNLIGHKHSRSGINH